MERTVSLEYAGCLADEIERLQRRIAELEAERDAAVADLKEASRYHSCPYCKYAKDFDISKEPCHSCNYGRKNWEWRGAQNLCLQTRKWNDNSGELIRCKNCKHFELDYFDNYKGLPLIVAHEICCFNKENPIKVSQNHYCSWGERKEE